MTYQHILLATLDFMGPPGPVAPEVASWPDEALRNLDGTDERFGLQDTAFWPLVLTSPAFEPATETLTDEIVGRVADRTAFRVTATRGKRLLTAAELAARRAELLAYVGEARYAREMAGVTVPGGFRVATDDRSKLLLAGSRIKAEADPTYSTKWKVSPTDRVEVPASQIIAMSDAVLAFVDACFDADDAACAAILAGTITTRAEVDAFIAHALP